MPGVIGVDLGRTDLFQESFFADIDAERIFLGSFRTAHLREVHATFIRVLDRGGR
jgi:hypothetical protein